MQLQPNWETLRGWSFLDVAVRGKYNYLFENYLNDRGLYPKIEAEIRQFYPPVNPILLRLIIIQLPPSLPAK